MIIVALATTLLGLSSCASNGAQTSTVAAASPMTSATPAMSNAMIEQALTQIEKDGAVAMVKDDAGFVEKTMGDNWVWTMANGMMTTRRQLLDDIKSHKYKFTAASIDDLKVYVYGSTAIVTGKQTVKGTFSGQDIGGTERFTDTFINQNGQWKVVATHNSPLMTK